MKKVPVEEFGKDHWSLLGHIETCCVDSAGESGKVDHDRMRTNPRRNPELGFHKSRSTLEWKDEYSTRLRSFPWGSNDEKEKAKHRVAGHDDWDCLEDLERAGLAELVSFVNGFVRMTETGLAMAAELRAHKARGGYFSNFTPSDRIAVQAAAIGDAPYGRAVGDFTSPTYTASGQPASPPVGLFVTFVTFTAPPSTAAQK